MFKAAKRSGLSHLSEALPEFVMGTQAESTVRAYQGAFDKWCEWADEFEFCRLPATSTSVSLYLMQMIQSNSSYPSIMKTVAAINWAHTKACLTSPTGDQLVHQIVNAAKRNLARTPQRKEPFTKQHVASMIKHLASEQSPINLRTAVMISLGFSGMLRWSDMQIIQWKDVVIAEEFVELRLSKRKNDQFRSGSIVRIARQKSGSECPKALIEKLADSIVCEERDFLLSNLRRVRGGNFKAFGRLSYTNARAHLRSCMEAIGLNVDMFGLHSLRSGGATAAAAGGVAERLIKKHGGWKSDAVHAYIEDSLQDCLKASRATDWSL